jgi:hypothetical protein
MDIIPIIFSHVKMIDKKEIPGNDKRELLYKCLIQIWGQTKFDQNKIYVDYCLETIIFISKTHLISNINQHTFNNKLCCF